MKLKKLAQFRIDNYDRGSRPTLATLRKKIKEGKLPGGLIDDTGRYWIDLDQQGGTNQTRNPIIGDDPILESILTS